MRLTHPTLSSDMSVRKDYQKAVFRGLFNCTLPQLSTLVAMTCGVTMSMVALHDWPTTFGLLAGYFLAAVPLVLAARARYIEYTSLINFFELNKINLYSHPEVEFKMYRMAATWSRRWVFNCALQTLRKSGPGMFQMCKDKRLVYVMPWDKRWWKFTFTPVSFL